MNGRARPYALRLARSGLALAALVAACRPAPPSPGPTPGPAQAPTATFWPPAPQPAATAFASVPSVAPPPPARASSLPPGEPISKADLDAANACAVHETCGACMHAGCGWCGLESRCTAAASGGRTGPRLGACAGRWTVSADCTISNKELAQEQTRKDERLARVVGALGPDGRRFDGRIEDLRKFTFEVRRGRCYVVAVRYATGAHVEWNVGPIVTVDAPFADGGRLVELGGGDAALERTCPQRDGTMTAYVGELSDAGHARNPGRGGFAVEIYSAPVSEGELAAAAARRAADDELRSVRAFCAACARDYAVCRLRGGTGCIAQYQGCLQLNRLSVRACEAGRFERPPKRPSDREPQYM